MIISQFDLDFSKKSNPKLIQLPKLNRNSEGDIRKRKRETVRAKEVEIEIQIERESKILVWGWYHTVVGKQLRWASVKHIDIEMIFYWIVSKINRFFIYFVSSIYDVQVISSCWFWFLKYYRMAISSYLSKIGLITKNFHLNKGWLKTSQEV